MSRLALQSKAEPTPAEMLQIRLVEFVRLARENGFRVGVAEEVDAHRVALHCGMINAWRLRWGLRSLLCSSQDDWERFDELFDAYWHSGKGAARTQSLAGALVKRKAQDGTGHKGSDGQASEADQARQAEGDDAGEGGVREGTSWRENLMRADFQFIADSGQMRAVELLVERLARRMRRRMVRRQKVQQLGRKIHLRRTLRNSLRYGGMPLQLAYQRRARRQPRLILIIDVSRSMSMYSYIFLRFARGIVNAFRDADAFAYHTRLVHITDALRQPDLLKVRHNLALISQGWSGGTRIGESLEYFNRDYGRLLNSRSVVMVVSDGLDTGEPERLSCQLELIKRRARKLVWLNPLLGRAGYEPKTASMQAALPLLDLFAPAHNLQSLMALESTLISL